MPANYTENYALNQWNADDKVLRTDFNADNAKIDAAIKQVTDTAALLSSGKADASALSSEVSTRTSQVNTINNTLAKKGNCTIYHTSYIGNGQDSRTLTFPKRPWIVFIMGENSFMRIMPGAPYTMCSAAASLGACCSAVWSDASVTWTFTSSSPYREYASNESGMSYQVVAFIDAST